MFGFSWQYMYAKTLNVTYEIRFGILGKLGIAHAKLITKGEHYRIEVKASTTGLAKTLSQNRQEKHISEGFIRNGYFISQHYEIIIQYGHKYRYKHYYIDYRNKRVLKTFLSKKDGKIIKKGEQILDFFASDDLLTLYFNIGKYIPYKKRSGHYRFKAVGAEKQHGLVEIIIPDNDTLPYYQEILGTGFYRYMTAIIHQKIFTSSKGELMLAIGKDGIAQKAVLKDLILFGDLEAKRIK